MTRETPLNKEGIKLAELGVGDTFGEEALISEAKRNATVTMLTDGALMRLGKQDFTTLLNEPMLQWVDYEQAKRDRARGRQVAGRAAAERIPEHAHRRGDQHSAVFHPPEAQRARHAMRYVVCCDTGRRSSAGAYILSERGFDAYVLKGGLGATDVVKPRRG